MTPFNMCRVSQAAQPQLEIPAGPRKGGGGTHGKAVTAHVQPFQKETENLENVKITQEQNKNNFEICLPVCLQQQLVPKLLTINLKSPSPFTDISSLLWNCKT